MSPTSGKRFTSESTRKLVRESEALLQDNGEADDADGTLAELAASFDELSQSERERIDELTRLLRLLPEGGASAALSRDGSFELKISDDRMMMTMNLTPAVAEGDPLRAEAVVACLRKQGITQGVDIGSIRTAVKQASAGDVVEDAVVVRGCEAEAGQDERLEFFGRESPDCDLIPISEHDFQSTRGGPIICNEGDVIVRRVAPTSGRPGYDAVGGRLDLPSPETRALEVGDNVSESANEYLAEVNGVVVWDSLRLEVRKVLVVNQDLTRADGPVQFEGDVHVRGAVRNEAVITATGNVQVDGPVEAATIESTEGNVLLRHGVAGRDRGVIRAHGDVHTRFAENVQIEARGNIVIDIGVLHSRLRAGAAIRLTRGRGQLLGGVAMAGEAIEAKQIGAESDVTTDICVGLSVEVMDALVEVDGEIARLGKRGDMAAELADRMQRSVGDPAKLSPNELATYSRLRETELTCSLKTRRLQQKREDVLKTAAEAHHGRVDVAGQLFPGVIVQIGSCTFENKEIQRRCRLHYDEAHQHIVALPLR